MKSYIVLLIAIATLVVGAYALRTEATFVQASIAVAEAMSGDTTGYERADRVRPLVFPEDYGAHPGFKTEWWYYTGNLATEEGQRFGYELTIFRFALAPPDDERPTRASDWATDQLFMGHFAVSAIGADAFYGFERFSRGALGLAGARAAPYRIWLDDWSMEATGETLFPLRLHAAQDGVVLDLQLDAAKPVVLQGDRGLDRKGPEPGNASYYYSFTRLPTEGTLRVGEETYTVRGLSWKDHEWSTSALGQEQVGWDWFALQLSDGREVMYYQLRRRDGSPSPFTSGVLVDSKGATQPLTPGDVRLDVLDTWTSPHSNAVYPAHWRFRLPSEQVDLQIIPHMADQELAASVRYWEGAVRVEGRVEGQAVTGNGYVEMTGYGKQEGGRGAGL